jgi:hypothetical protein
MRVDVAIVSLLFAALAFQQEPGPEPYLSWSASEAEAIGRASYKQGRVGGIFDMRGLKTERSYNYKLAATWLSPDVIRATARLLQLRSRLSDAETRGLVAEADPRDLTVVNGGNRST